MGTRGRNAGTTDAVFASNLRVARGARGLTLDDLAEAIAGTDTPIIKSGLSKAETGSRTLTIGEAANLCRALDVPLERMTQGPLSVAIHLG